MTPWSTPDLSDITQVVLGILQSYVTGSVANVNVTAMSPEVARKDSSLCQLTLYLLHVSRDPFWRNTPVGGPPAQLNAAQPLSLNLSYLLTAWHDTDFGSEQHAMSVALQAIHSFPIVNAKVLGRSGLPAQLLQTFQQWMPNGGEFTMSIEADTIEEMSRLWQAFACAIRLSALIRVGVVFVAPQATPILPYPQATVANVWVNPTPPGAQPTSVTTPLLFSSGGGTFTPAPSGTDPDLVQATAGPVIAAAGSDLMIFGYGLDPADAPDVFLGAPASATPWTVTSWRQKTTTFGALDLLLPSAYGAAASSTTLPPPGLYSLSVSGAAAGARSNAIPLVIAPRVDNVAVPPQLVPDGTGLYSIAGAGFIPGATIVALGTIPLTAANAPGHGQFAVSAAGDAISFMLPNNPSPADGAYPVLIQVNGIAAEPGWFVEVSSP
jgi:hypothetical protein